MRRWLLTSLLSFTFGFAFTQSNTSNEIKSNNLYGEVQGIIVNEQDLPIQEVQIIIQPANLTTTTDSLGFYSIKVPANKPQNIAFNHINYIPFGKVFTVSANAKKQINAKLVSSSVATGTVVIQEQKNDNATEIKIDAKTAQKVVGVSDDGLTFIKSQASVSSNNELSSSYSVRGGSFDENLIYVNGIQVYRPFLVRAGQQEGLSFVNGDMIRDITFSAGGFDAKYGDKLSSVLDINYLNPDSLTIAFSASLLGARATVGNKHGKLKYIMSGRYKSNSYVLGALETQGDYLPVFYDYQIFTTYEFNKKASISFLGNSSLNQFKMIPRTRTTRFGGINQAFQLTVAFAGQEITEYQTNFGALSFDYRPFGNDSTLLKFTASGFSTYEEETFDLEGAYRLNELETNFGGDDFGEESALLGTGSFLDHSRNFLDATIFNFEHTGRNIWKQGIFLWGAKFQQEKINDELLEWRNQDSAGYSVPFVNSNDLKFEEYLISKNQLISNRASGFIQNNWRFLKKNGKSQLFFNTGIRANYWDFNQQTIISPRASLTYAPSRFKKDKDGKSYVDSTNFTYRLAWGHYYQQPFYRELRDFDGNVVEDIEAQKSVHYVAGVDYDFFAWGRQFSWRSEAYYKQMSNIIPFDVENVRIRYYGENSAKAYAYGLESRINGEFIKGLESWLSASFMQADEDIENDIYYEYYNSNGEKIVPGFTVDQTVDDSISFTRAYMPRPTDQRFSFKIFFQDEMPRFQQLKVHLNLVYSTGLPFGTPGSVRDRSTARMPSYRRADIGFTFQVVEDNMLYKKNGKMNMPTNHWLKHFNNLGIRVEVFNLLDIANTISYLWVSDINNQEYAVPNFLTPRLLNLRITGKL